MTPACKEYNISHLSEQQVWSTLVWRSHAPDQEETLAEEVAGEEVKQRVHQGLDDGEHGQHHPVPHPGERGLPVITHDGVETLVSWVEEPHSCPDHQALRWHLQYNTNLRCTCLQNYVII